MEVIKTWIVSHINGRTQMYLTKNGDYILVVPTSTGQCWTDVCEIIDAETALNYIK